MNNSVFICHSLEDADTVCRLQKSLEAKGFNTRADNRVIRSGDPLNDNIKADINTAGVFLLVVSKNANSSEWVQKETQYALKIRAERTHDLCIIPILLDDAELGALKWMIPDNAQAIGFASSDEGVEEAMPKLMNALEEALFPSGSPEWLT